MTPDDIREARQRLGLSGERLGVLLGYGPQGARARVSELEAGRRNPSDAVVRLLRAYLEGYRPKDWSG